MRRSKRQVKYCLDCGILKTRDNTYIKKNGKFDTRCDHCKKTYMHNYNQKKKSAVKIDESKTPFKTPGAPVPTEAMPKKIRTGADLNLKLLTRYGHVLEQATYYVPDMTDNDANFFERWVAHVSERAQRPFKKSLRIMKIIIIIESIALIANGAGHLLHIIK